ncbi:MAG: Gfo/Idh/MocA family oxidoreductase [Pirellulales bacterium]
MQLPSVLMVGTGEYTSGLAHGSQSASDKRAGVIGIVLFDLKRRGKVGQLAIAGTNGTRFPILRDHFQKAIADRYRNMDVSVQTYPGDDVAKDSMAYRHALSQLKRGDIVTIFTPDDTHFEIAMAAIQQGCHVLIAKPIVKTTQEHLQLIQAAKHHDVLVAMEVHKRWDPIYVDARDRIRDLGKFSFFQSYMSQPKSQLETFRQWAGKSSDISYYLNSHHIDFHAWSVRSFAEPISVVASAATGVAHSQGIPTEDSITLLTRWRNIEDGSLGTAIYTASWIAPKSDVHSQQRFFYAGQAGEIQVDQAHRGYSMANDSTGFSSLNPLFMKYTPDSDGYFAGQSAYGYRSLEVFIDAAREIQAGRARPSDFQTKLATIEDTYAVTAILEAGRQSLDRQGAEVMLARR